MNQTDIEDIVRAVIHQIGKSPGTPAEPPAPPSVADPLAIDLGSDEARAWLGVLEPKSQDVLKELRLTTRARVCAGRTGPRPRTQSLLRFLADHSRSKDTVLSEIPAEWVRNAGLFEVQTQITEKDQYLTRPDLGRVLSPEGVAEISSRCIRSPDVQVIVSDGLSTDAATANFDDIVPPLLRGLEAQNLKVGTPFFVRFGRVKVQDQIGELLDAKVVILLIGERPGLGQSESMSCYAVYCPTRHTVEAERTCLSNIHRGGTPPVEAAAVIVELACRMLEEKASGIALSRKTGGA